MFECFMMFMVCFVGCLFFSFRVSIDFSFEFDSFLGELNKFMRNKITVPFHKMFIFVKLLLLLNLNLVKLTNAETLLADDMLPQAGGKLNKDKDSKEAAAFSTLAFSYYNQNILKQSQFASCYYSIKSVSKYSTQIVAGLKSEIEFSIESPSVSNPLCQDLYCEVERIEVVWQKTDKLNVCCVIATEKCSEEATYDFEVKPGDWSSLSSDNEELQEQIEEAAEEKKGEGEKIEEEEEENSPDPTRKDSNIMSINKTKAFILFVLVSTALGIIYYLRKQKDERINRAQRTNQMTEIPSTAGVNRGYDG